MGIWFWSSKPIMYESKDDLSIAIPGTNADIVFNYTKGDWRQKFGEQVDISAPEIHYCTKKERKKCEHYGEFKQSKWQAHGFKGSTETMDRMSWKHQWLTPSKFSLLTSGQIYTWIWTWFGFWVLLNDNKFEFIDWPVRLLSESCRNVWEKDGPQW